MVMFVQEDPAVKRKRRLGESLMVQGADTSPVQHPLQALARILQGGLGGYMSGSADKTQRERETRASETLSQALTAGFGKPAESSGGIDWQAQPPSASLMAQILAGNPDTAPFGMQAALSQIPKPRASGLLPKEEYEQQLALARAKKDPQQTGEIGPFAGTGMDQQATNILLTRDPSSREYAAAYSRLSAPRTVLQDGQLVTITPDMSAYDPPGRRISQKPATSGQPGVAVTDVPGSKRLTPGEEATDRAFAKQYDELIAGGGLADIQKSVRQLDSVADTLSKSDNITGPVVGNVPEFMRNIINPQSVDVQQQVEEIVQRNLRLVLGAQFTEREGTRLIERAYNPKLDEATNAKRLARLSDALKKAAQAKLEASQYWETHGTLKGYKGTRLFTLQDIEQEAGLSPLPSMGEAPGGWSIQRVE